MKILLSIPGNASTVPMSYFAPTALRQLGHEVTIFSYHYENLFERVIKKSGVQRLYQYKNRQLLSKIREYKPDLFLSIYGEAHTAETIQQIKNMKITTACWWLNDPFQLPFGVNDSAPVYDFFFSNGNGTKPDYVKHGVKNHFFLPVGIDPDTHKNLNIIQKKNDVVFMGDHHTIRERVLEDLVKAGVDVSIYGPWKRKLSTTSPLQKHLRHGRFFTPQQMAQVFNESKIVLNLHTWYGRWNYGVNPRLFESAGCGAFQLVDFKQEIPDFFTNKESIVWFEKLEELPSLIQYYLQHDVERNNISKAAEAIASKHTYKARMEQLLKTCGF
jgi:spore maturation protein CgeB